MQLIFSNMPACLNIVLKYFSFTFTIHLAYSDARL